MFQFFFGNDYRTCQEAVYTNKSPFTIMSSIFEVYGKGNQFQKKTYKGNCDEALFHCCNVYQVSRELWKWLVEIDLFALYMVKLSQS